MKNLAPRIEIAAVVLGLVLLLTGFIQIIMAERQLSAASEVTASARRLSKTLVDLETGYRGYVIAGTDDFLEPYRDSLTSLKTHLDTFGTAIQPFDSTGESRAATTRLVDSLRTEAVDVIQTRLQQGFDAARRRIVEGEGKPLMDRLRDELDTASSNAQALRERLDWSGVSYPSAAVASGFILIVAAAPLIYRRSRRQRQESERARQLFTDVMAKAPVGLALVDGLDTIVQANAAFNGLFSYSTTPTAFSSLPDDFVRSVSPALRAALSGFRASYKSQPAVPVDLEIDGKVQHLQATFFPVEIPNDEGADRRAAAMLVSDVTRQRVWEAELEAARDAAEAANRAKSAFLANMSHELRTPLTAVLGYCELLEEELADANQQPIVADLHKIELNARHLLGLINDVLDLSKIEAQKLEIAPREVHLADFLSDLETAAGGLMQTKNNHFKIETKTRLRSIITDDMRLRQILLNLVGNAAKFTENGSIRLVVSEAGASGRIDFSVIDTGIGMTEEQVAGLFQRFQQADQSTIRKYGGTGLGLALTKALAGLLGGEIRVTSEPGVGTTAIVSLPILSEQINDNADVPTIASNQPDFSQRHDGLRILIVDDEAGAREHLYRVLSREGFNVATCADATTAVETAATFAPAAILLDVMMPRMDGWQVLQHLRADPRTADIPVIMQTLLDAEHVAFALGANGYLRKPLDRSSILQALAGVKTVDKPAAMIIDDDPEARRRIMRVLRRDGWTVTEFGDGKSALDALDTWHPDVVVVDLVMPVMDGHAFIHAVRNQPKWRDLPIVVLTAEDIADVQVDSLTGMTAEVVQKGSMPLAELVSRLRRHAPAGNVSTQTELAGA